MDRLLHEPCSLLVLMLILLAVGYRMAGQSDALLNWGFRLAAATFIVTAAYGCCTQTPLTAAALLSITFTSLLVAGLALGLSWIALARLSFTVSRTLVPLVERIRSWRNATRARQEEFQRQHDDEFQERRARQEWERSAPEREQKRREAEARTRTEAEAERRREHARVSCELLFNAYAPDIGQRFSKAMFDDFVRKYMGSARPAEEVEERARQLQGIIQQHREKVQPPPRFTSMGELAKWFQTQAQQIEALPIDDRAKRVHLANLNRRFQELMQQHLENLQP